jgi:transcriptional regulator with XRE-family HTH domain
MLLMRPANGTLDDDKDLLSKAQDRRPEKALGDIAGRVVKLQQLGEADNAFADRIGVSPAVYSNWKTGKHDVSVDQLKLMVAKGVSARYLLFGDGPGFDPPDIEPTQRAVQEIEAVLARMHDASVARRKAKAAAAHKLRKQDQDPGRPAAGKASRRRRGGRPDETDG